jgi:hypothetical protein
VAGPDRSAARLVVAALAGSGAVGFAVWLGALLR